VHLCICASLPLYLSHSLPTPYYLLPTLQIKIAQKRQLREEDVWDMPKGMRVADVHDGFKECWESEKASAHREGRETSLLTAILNTYWWGFAWGGCLQFSFMVFQLGQVCVCVCVCVLLCLSYSVYLCLSTTLTL
jgi:hypothetical protein